MKQKSKLRVISLLEGLLACLGFIVVVTVGYTGDRKKTFDLMEAYTESIANGISSFFTDAAAVASAAATLHSTQDLNWSMAAMDFAGFIRSSPYVHRISLVDSDGYIYDAYETGPSGNPWQGGRRTEDNAVPDSAPIVVLDRDYFRKLVEENMRGEFFVMINEPFVPSGLTEKAFVTSTPIIRNGRAVGTVSVAQTALELSLLYGRLTADFLDKFGREAHMYLVSEGGQLVSDLEYNEAYNAYFDELFGLTETVSVFTLGEDAVSAIDAAVKEEKRVISARLEGRPHLVTGAKIEGTSFVACLAVPRSYMLKTSRAILVASSSFLLVSALVMLAGMACIKKEEHSRNAPSAAGKQGKKAAKKPSKGGKSKQGKGEEAEKKASPHFGEEILSAPFLSDDDR